MRTSHLIFTTLIVVTLGQTAVGMVVTINGQTTSSVCTYVGQALTFTGSVSKSGATITWSGATPVTGQPLVAKKTFMSTGTFTVTLTATLVLPWEPFSGTATCTVTVYEVTLEVEDNLTECMEGRYVTFTATASNNFPHGITNPICFTFHFQTAEGTPWTAVDWSADLVEDHTTVADSVLGGDADHKFTTPIYVEASGSGCSYAKSTTMYMDIYELWIEYVRDSSSGEDWKVIVGKNIAYSAIAASDAKNWAWDMQDGWPDAWNPTGGNSKTGSGMVIPNSDLPTSNGQFGDAYGTVDVFCEDGDGGNNHFYSTSMDPPQKATVFFDRDATTHPGGTTPNWYYYWSKSAANTGINQYNAGLSYDGMYTFGDNYFEIGPSAKGQDGGWVVRGDGIDNFGSTCIHEKAHMDYYFTAWNPYDAAQDADGDFLKDSDEPNLTGRNGLPYDPIKGDTNGDVRC